jgi:hypothetical protein
MLLEKITEFSLYFLIGQLIFALIEVIINCIKEWAHKDKHI